ncbi:hypothetical protein FPFC_012120 [Fructobacillus pseudoficulneus]|uniref:Uncharacterized protein n=1 Tax=Fructobacillus pseudoficulneus TaxID=220714 RepID=A0A3F3GVJ3_9LACO|nr:hypothetical protein [Fructobacillus pseudoficulneus]GAP02332.1 hypothetical protein FPFC_012120 [Fructobacillus pseudoficulneus]SEH36399.1 hypothetical protein SAMN05660469_0284 [Fructobacillus pseudoficulneus]
MSSAVYTTFIKSKRFLSSDFVLIILFSFLAIVPAFAGKYYNLSIDGAFHLERFANVAASLKHGEWPSVFNFLYDPSNSQPGVAINSMYPWISGLIFIIPQVIIKNQLIALAIGFYILNAITMLNMKFLLQEFTNKKLYIWLGIIIYEFNNFHFIDLYTRTAVGESFGFAWMPLVVLGLVKIGKSDKMGAWVLGCWGLQWACLLIVMFFL